MINRIWTSSARRAAFTMIELITVVSIIAVLAAIAVPNFLEAQVRSKVSRVRSDMAFISAALENYRLDHGMYPRQTWPIHPVELGHLRNQLNQTVWPGQPSLLDDINRIKQAAGVATPTPTPAPTTVTYDWNDPNSSNPFLMDEGNFGPPVGMIGQPVTDKNGLSAEEAETSAALALHGLIHSPFVLNGLQALTTPVSYIGPEFFRDPFADGGLGSWGWGASGANGLKIDPVVCFVNFEQITREGWTIAGLGERLPYVLYSASPSTSMPMFPFPPVQPFHLYDPTNGTISDGIVVNWKE